MKNVILVGAGQYGRSCYLSFFLRKKLPDVRLAAVLDLLKERDNIDKYLSQFNEKIETRFLDKPMNGQGLVNYLDCMLDALDRHDEKKITHAIISTPPEERMEYYKYFLERGISILADKPLTAPKGISVNLEAIEGFERDYAEICSFYEEALKKFPNVKFDVMVQRRFHPVFETILKYLIEVSSYTGCALTHFQGTHADGQWRLPSEILDIGYHGFNIGQGKASHSGYHFFDIAARFVEKTMVAAGKSLESVEAYSVPTMPDDYFQILDNKCYRRVFKDDYEPMHRVDFERKTHGFGEIDCLTTLNFKNRNYSLVSGNLNLLHNSFSGRYWHKPNLDDLYRSNGRLRQELHYFVQGPFQSISVVSLRGCSKVPVARRIEKDSAKEPLEIHIFRNTGINRNWKAYERLTISDLIPDLENQDAHLAHARDKCIQEFVGGETFTSDVLEHELSVNVMAAACESIVTRSAATRPFLI